VRSIYPHTPVSRLALWSRRLAFFALATAALSIIVVRSGFLDIVPALITLGAALSFAAFGIVLAFLSFIGIWREGLGGLGAAIAAVFIGLALLAYPAYSGYRASKLPAIYDITTDPANPPRFDVIARLRPRGSNAYPGGAMAEKQRQAYPEIEPLQVLMPPKAVYDIAYGIATKRKWHVVDARPPTPPARREGVIEAVARTPIMGFREDVVIRVTPVGNGSRIDVRSASRYGWHDLGGNAARVSSLLEEIDEALASAPEQKQPEPKKQPAKRQPAKR
jgi:uncharacterized protein (DUF1499 family)